MYMVVHYTHATDLVYFIGAWGRLPPSVERCIPAVIVCLDRIKPFGIAQAEPAPVPNPSNRKDAATNTNKRVGGRVGRPASDENNPG